ncbi:MAG: ATP-binding protein [Thermoanaerobaculia bacterium]
MPCRPRHHAQVQILDQSFLRADGSTFPVEILASPILDDAGEFRGIVVSFTDATEKKRLQDEISRNQRLSSLGRVTASMSHEFNNVLMSVQPFAEIILRLSKDEKILDAAHHIVRAVQRGRRVTEETLRFTRPSEPVTSPVEVAPLIAKCAEQVRGLLPTSIILRTSVADDSYRILADRNQITQVVTNLLLNARDAIGSEPGSILVSAEACVAGEVLPTGRVCDGFKLIHFKISDDGPGISETNMARIFEPFFTTKPKGTGLGLPIAHQIVTLHGGQIQVDSTAGKGTTIHIYLPVAAPPPPEETTRSTGTRGAYPSRVLVVEDEEAIATGLKGLLDAKGIETFLARDGAEATSLMADVTPEVLVIDVGLPDIDGIDLYGRIVERYGAVPTIFSSGHVDAERIRPLDSPANRVVLLKKPYSLEALLQELDSIWNRTAPTS